MGEIGYFLPPSDVTAGEVLVSWRLWALTCVTLFFAWWAARA